MMLPLLQVLALLVIVALVGAAVCAMASSRDQPARGAVLLPVGVATLVFYGAVLAYFGVFGVPALAGFMFASVLVLLLRARALRVMPWALVARPTWSETAVLLLPAVLLLLLTPRWSFLVAPGMDAGNYSLYGQWIASKGSFYWDVSGLLERGADAEWLKSRNTWDLDIDAGIARPVYLYGYPVLLGIANAGLFDANASAVVNPMLAGLVCLCLLELLRRAGAAKAWSLGVVAVVAASPVFAYYAKQLMSEMQALLGAGLVFLALALAPSQRALRALALACGMFLLLFTKLDAFMLVGVLSLGIALSALRGPPGERLALSATDAITLGVAAAATLFLAAVVSQTTYLEHFAIPLVGAGTVAVLMYAAMLFAGYLALAMRSLLFARMPRSDVVASAFASAACVTIGAGVLFIGLWSLALRPIGADILVDHDSINLPRLLVFAPALPTLVFLLGMPFLLDRARGVTLAMALAAGAGMVLFLLDSHHSSPDIWWSRRYLAFTVFGLVALASIVGGAVLPARYRVLLSAAALLGVAVQLPLAYRLLMAPVNPDAPRVLALLQEQTRGAGALIALEGGRRYNAQLNTLRAVFDGEMLMNVPAERLEDALAVVTAAECPMLASSIPLDRPGWRLVWSGQAEMQWINTAAEAMVPAPRSRRASAILLYSRCGSAPE